MFIYLETGGLVDVPIKIYSAEALDTLYKEFTNLLDVPSLKSTAQVYLSLIDSLHLPKYRTNVIEDLPVVYLGYKRNGQTSFCVRLREAWNVLTGKPSQAYFTQENGDYADGLYKDAMRVTLDGQKVRNLAPTAFASSFSPTGIYILPVFKFIPDSLRVPEILKEYQHGSL